jgi:uncharacterized membrane protein YfcA
MAAHEDEFLPNQNSIAITEVVKSLLFINSATPHAQHILVGIGGGTLSVPFMLWHNVPLHRAIATSAAIGFPIALAGAVGYMVGGWGVSDLPAGSVGFVYLPALAGIVLGSVLTAPLGARTAHQLPVRPLKRIFALLLITLALRMAWTF